MMRPSVTATNKRKRLYGCSAIAKPPARFDKTSMPCFSYSEWKHVAVEDALGQGDPEAAFKCQVHDCRDHNRDSGNCQPAVAADEPSEEAHVHGRRDI